VGLVRDIEHPGDEHFVGAMVVVDRLGGELELEDEDKDMVGEGRYVVYEVYFADGRSPSFPEDFDDYDDALAWATRLARTPLEEGVAS
jgi:hypothetical protein